MFSSSFFLKISNSWLRKLGLFAFQGMCLAISFYSGLFSYDSYRVISRNDQPRATRVGGGAQILPGTAVGSCPKRTAVPAPEIEVMPEGYS